jgi:non-specific serine/threonine protein kinase
MEGHPDRAVESFRRHFEADPRSLFTRMIWALCQALAGRTEEARGVAVSVSREAPATFPGRMGRFLGCAWAGDRAGTLAAATPELLAAARHDGHFSWNVAQGYALIGERDAALDWLENAVARGFLNRRFFEEWDPALAGLRRERRFRDLMERVRGEQERFEV